MRAMMGALRTAAAGAVLAVLCSGWAAEAVAVGPPQSPQVLMRSESREPATNSKSDVLFNETPSSVADVPISQFSTMYHIRIAVGKIGESIAALNDMKVAMDTVETAVNDAQDSLNATLTVVDNALASGADTVGEDAVVEKTKELTQAENALNEAVLGLSKESVGTLANNTNISINLVRAVVEIAKKLFYSVPDHIKVENAAKKASWSTDVVQKFALAAIEAFQNTTAAPTLAASFTDAADKARHAVQGVRALQDGPAWKKAKQAAVAAREATGEAEKEFRKSEDSHTQAYKLIRRAVAKADASIAYLNALLAEFRSQLGDKHA